MANVLGFSPINQVNNLNFTALTCQDLTVTNNVTIPDDSLTISDTAGLQSALDTLTTDTATNTANIATNTGNIATNTSDITDLQNDKQDNLTSTSDITVRDIDSHGDFRLRNGSNDVIFRVIDGGVLDASLKFFDSLGTQTLSIAGNTGNLTGGNTCSFDSLSANTLCQSPYFFNTGAQNTNVASCTRKDYVDDALALKQDELDDTDNIKLRSLVLGNGYNPIPTNDGNLYAYTANLTTSLIVAGTNISTAITQNGSDITTLETDKQDNITSSTQLQFNRGLIGSGIMPSGSGELVVENSIAVNGIDIETELNSKQDILTAGTDIEITAGNVINYTGSAGFSLTGMCFGSTGGSSVNLDTLYPTDTSFFPDFRSTNDYTDSNYYTYTAPSPVTNNTNEGLKILVGGRYEISYLFPLKNISFTNRVNFRIQAWVNGSNASWGRGQTFSYARDDSFVVHASNSATFTINLSVNDWLKFNLAVSKNDTTFGDNFDGTLMLFGGTFSIKYLGS